MPFKYINQLSKSVEISKNHIWENFEKVINKAKEACENSGISVFDHFPDARKMVQIGTGAEREQKNNNLKIIN